MYSANEQISELSKSNVAQASKLAAIALGNAEKLVKLNLAAARSVLAQGLENANAVASAKDPQEFLSLRSRLAESGVQSALAYTRTLYELTSEAQAELTAVSEEVWAGYNKGVANWVDNAAKSAPAGSDLAVNAFRSTVAATTAAFDQFQRATRQAVNLADASVRAASASATKAATPKGRK